MKKEPIDKWVINPVSRFISNSTASGVVLLIAVLIALFFANSIWAETYHHFWMKKLSIGFDGFEVSKTLHHWINDGLMAVFFFVIGLELKGEILDGELSNPKNAILPIVAGVGGMLLPATIYLIFNSSGEASNGWGIPMATDIAFALGLLHLLGKRVPVSLKIFLTVLAIADDIGAVLVIAFFYTSDISVHSLLIASIFLSIMFIGNFVGIRHFLFYTIVGLGGFWLAFSMSGVHATISGVIAAFAIPADVKLGEKEFSNRLRSMLTKYDSAKSPNSSLISKNQVRILEKMRYYSRSALTPLQHIQYYLEPVVVFVIMPLFALANAGVTFSGNIFELLTSPVSLGIIFGLIFGKFIGVVGFTRLLVSLKIAQLPSGVKWRHILGIGFIAGVGFTMSLFINNLAFESSTKILEAKIGVLIASLISGVIGFAILRWSSKKD